VITHSPAEHEEDIKKNLLNKKIPKDVFPVGRLDKDSHGLIILTNDGRITDKLLNPKYTHEKEYVVKTSNKLRSSFKQKMEKGVNIEGYITKPCKVIIINENTFRVILSEGKKHQIRRMCSALFQEVSDLKRIRIMNIELGKLRNGEFREIKNKELDLFLKKIFVN
jgi:23S rRNA pseudouridine2604 synthase